ncbi:MAG: DUF4956 domain-containing protein [bacterium]
MDIDSILESVVLSSLETTLEFDKFIFCLVSSLVLGFIIALLYTFKTKYTKSFFMTLAIIPSIVTTIILMVNGNLGAGVAVSGAFSLVRFRSTPGTFKEIGAIFLAMGTGLAIGMGYVFFAVIFVFLISGANMLLTLTTFGENNRDEKILSITIPEDLDYSHIFDDLISKYTSEAILTSVKTSNMGSLFKLKYELTLVDDELEKKFIDELRCRNGNLEISISKKYNSDLELR